MTFDQYVTRKHELLARLPEELREWADSCSYDRGHSAGYSEVILELQSLVDGLEKPLAAFRERTTREAVFKETGYML
jgi:hypothetical protein